MTLGAPEVAHLPVDLHEQLVERPSSVARVNPLNLNPALADLGGELRIEVVS